ncbi:hypothetical protein [Azohydromonas aeria]|uniref:hypothetical protein n=1 Tax=Azohydromonas aeria TaxID=2590212 RepID=UPI0012F7BE19|nr:hypothetical protein [Azohydromonas aeria]
MVGFDNTLAGLHTFGMAALLAVLSCALAGRFLLVFALAMALGLVLLAHWLP